MIPGKTGQHRRAEQQAGTDPDAEFFALAREIIGRPFDDASGGMSEGGIFSRRILLAIRPAASPCSVPLTVRAQRVPRSTLVSQKEKSGRLLFSVTQRSTVS